MTVDLIQLSRTISYALRHQPAQFGLSLDDEGWVFVDDLLEALRHHRQNWRELSVDDFASIIAESDKRRYEMRDNMIRACYGHSVAQKIVRAAATPPEILFHGTTPTAAKAIKIDGLKPMGRQYVHLSEDEETARLVALRRTRQPVILKIVALKAHQKGNVFYLGNDKVWLADRIEPAFITQA